MSFFSRRRKRSDNPPEMKALTENLVAQVWHSVRRDGSFALHWNVVRKNPDDATRPFRTLRVESLFEAPLFLAKLALALSKVEGLAKDVRSELEVFSRHLTAVVELRESNGADDDTRTPGTILGR